MVDLGGGPETLFDSTDQHAPLVDANRGRLRRHRRDGVEIAGFEIDAGDNALDFKAPATGAGAAFHDNMVMTSVGAATWPTPWPARASSAWSTTTSVERPGRRRRRSGGHPRPGRRRQHLHHRRHQRRSERRRDARHLDLRQYGVAATPAITASPWRTYCSTPTRAPSPSTRSLRPAHHRGHHGQPGAAATASPWIRCAATSTWARSTVYAGTAGGLTDLAFSVTGDGTFNAGAGTGFQLTTTGGTVHAVDGPALRSSTSICRTWS